MESVLEENNVNVDIEDNIENVFANIDFENFFKEIQDLKKEIKSCPNSVPPPSNSAR